MRIALVITELEPGGAERCLVQLACYLTRQGHTVGVFALGAAPSRPQLLEQLRQLDIACHFGGAQRVWQFLRIASWLRRQLSIFTPDVVQSMLFHANVVAALAVPPSARLVGGVRVRQPQRWRWWLQRWAARRMHQVVCVSQQVAAHCQRQEQIPENKLVVIPNGIHLRAVEAAVSADDWVRFGIPPEAPVLLFVGRLDPQKGIETLLGQADELLHTLPHHHLVIVGDGPLAASLARRHATLRSAARVHLVGWQPQPEAWMRRCQVLLLPARYEGMPNVILEAMAVCKPVVVYDVDGVRELLGSGPTADAQIVHPEDLPAFFRAVRRFANAGELREECGQANRLRVELEFPLEQQLAKYLSLYASLDARPPDTERREPLG